MREKDYKNNIIKYSLMVVSALFLIFTIAVYYINYHTKHIFLMKIYNWHVDYITVFYLAFILIASWSVRALIIFWRKSSKIIYKILIVLSWVILIILFLYANLVIFIKSDDYYYDFQSDNKKHELVVEESTFLFSSTLRLYKRDNSIMVSKLDLDDVFFDDAYRPISFGEYFIKWEDDILNFYFGYEKYDDWKKIRIDFTSGITLEEKTVKRWEVK